MVTVRRWHQHADAAKARRPWLDVLAVPRPCARRTVDLLTGRNHHTRQCGHHVPPIDRLSFAGSRTRARPSDRSSRTAGWSTFWIGKNHNVPEQDVASGASRKQWPLQKGFDRYYGFLGGETNQWYPDLTEDNRFVDQEYGPDEGYHLSKDLVDKAIGMIRDQKASNPSRPWYMWLCPGANHAPHHCPTGIHRQVQGQVRRWL